MKKYSLNNNFYSGKYYKRLFVVFMAVAVLFSALFTFSLFHGVSLLRESEKTTYETFAQNRYNLIDTAIAVIIGGMDSFVKNPYLEEWADAEDANNYYKKAISLCDYIKSVSSQLGSLAYEVAVIGERYNTMTLSGLGSGPFKWYAEKETSLTDEQISSTCMSLQDSNSTAVLPVYGETGRLKELYFMRKQQWKTQVTFVVFKVFAAPMFVPAGNENFYICAPHNVCICACSGQDNKVFAKKNKNSFTYLYSLHIPSWGLNVELYKSTGMYLLLSCMSVVLSALVFIVCVFTAKRTARRLYYPLGEIVYKSLSSRSARNCADNTTEKANKPMLDEFEILRNNSRKMELLSQELQKTVEENEALALQKYNRGLLEGIVSAKDKENKDTFFVALVLLTDESDGRELERRPYIQLFADACAIADEQLQYIQYGVKEFALILNCKTPERAENKLKSFLTKLQNSTDSGSVKIQAALSDCVTGKILLQDAFMQARSILGFRHTQPHASILTSSVISFFVSGLYDYPLETEKKLLALLIGGSRQTPLCFDEVIQKNIRTVSLSFAARQNLLYALCGTLIRALQELKSTPEELYGKTVNWAALYTGKPDEKAFGELKSIATDISEAVRKSTSDTDAKILQLMRKYIYANFQRDISLQDLSDEFNITPKYCSKLFARLSNNTFKNYLNAFRVEQAQKMLSEEPLIKIGELAGKVGFNSATSFIRVFNKYTGLSPKVYAEQILEKDLQK